MLSRLRQQKSAMLSRRLQRIPDDDLALLAAALPVLEALTRFED
jgi:hypothetical protein